MFEAKKQCKNAPDAFRGDGSLFQSAGVRNRPAQTERRDFILKHRQKFCYRAIRERQTAKS